MHRQTEAWLVWAVAAVLVIGISLILSLGFLRASAINVTLNTPSPERITSPQTREYLSTILTERRREEEALKVQNIYTPLDRTIGRNQVNLAGQLFDFIEVVRADTYAAPDKKRAALRAIEIVEITPALAEQMLVLDAGTLQLVESETRQIIESIMRGEVRESDLPEIKAHVRGEMSLNLSAEQERLVMALAPQLVRPNIFYDETSSSSSSWPGR